MRVYVCAIPHQLDPLYDWRVIEAGALDRIIWLEEFQLYDCVVRFNGFVGVTVFRTSSQLYHVQVRVRETCVEREREREGGEERKGCCEYGQRDIRP